MDIRRVHEEFIYNDQKINVRIDTYFSNHIDEDKDSVHFDYKGINVNETFDNDLTGYYLTCLGICEMIDALGTEKYQQFCKYKDDIQSIQRNRIIIDSKVFGYYEHPPITSGELKRYLMFMEMADGNSIDGHPKSKLFYDDDIKKRGKTFQNLINNAIEYFHKNGVLPAEKHYDHEQTIKFNELQKWFEENIPEQYYKHLY